MNLFEQKLKALSLKKPSPELKRRIFKQSVKPISLFELFRQPIEFRWALALSLIMGIAGFFTAHIYNPGHHRPAPNITYEIHLQNPLPNDKPTFDMTSHSQKPFLSGNLSVNITNKEI